MMNIHKDKKLERRCTFFILGDANAMLTQFRHLDDVYFRIHFWYMITQDVNENWEI